MASANPDIPAAKDIKWDETFDVVVVGSGIAATCAGNEALDLGAKRVIMVDKMPVFGGNSAITGFWINVPRTPEQLAHGVKDDSVYQNPPNLPPGTKSSQSLQRLHFSQ